MKTKFIAILGLSPLLFVTGCETTKPTQSSHPLSAGAIQTVTYDATKRAAFFLYVPDGKFDRNIRKALEYETDHLLKLQKQTAKQASNRSGSAPESIKREIADTIRRINQLGALAVRPVVLAENPPDAARSTSNLLSIAASIPNTDATGSVTAASVSQIVALAKLESQNYILRDALYRLNEGLLLRPNLLDDDEYLTIFTNILETVKSINQMQTAKDSVKTTDANSQKTKQ